ncbi:hypothetical protein [Hyalangium rubrum]|uniref:Lipoprotein n=1 Tax=Hyalangium rubrum TaxID=3103134 RepID=A0ABU5H451_9BACT|nr:hypothetical protein [Hyalangium sp. s54d21]MDY7227874.1 hypothetical protein [Hyalangium sp. s54d21]
MTVLLRALGLCALFLALPAHAATDPLAQGTEDHEAQLIGWSSDEKRFALRLYLRDAAITDGSHTDPVACEGYLTNEGNPLHGGLVVLVYERGRLLSTFPIYDREKCTPPEESKKRQEAAQKKLDALGIKLDARGQTFIPQFNGPTLTVNQGPQAPFTFEFEERLQGTTTHPKSGEARGTSEQELYLRKGETRQKVLTRKVPFSYSTRMTGARKAALDRVFVSPSGNTLVVLSNEFVANMASRRKSLRLMGVLGWSGGTLKPL